MKLLYAFFVVVSVIALEAFFELEPIEEGFKELSFHKTTCAYNALKDFAQLCRENGAENMNAELRLALAVKLSLCEFIEAGLGFPTKCNIIHESEAERQATSQQYQECIADFRAVPQLWTTYSGNYRKLRLLCFEEQAPFIKDSILDLFLNITRLYSKFYSNAQDAATSMEASQEKATGRLKDLQNLIDKIFHQMTNLNSNLVKQHEQTMLYQTSTQDSLLERFHFMNNMMIGLLHNSSQSIGDLNCRIEAVQILFASLAESIFSKGSNMSNSLDIMDKRQLNLMNSAQAHIYMTERISNGLSSLEFRSSGLLSKIDQLRDKTELLLEDLVANHATAKLNVEILLDLFHDTLAVETQKLGELTITALDPVMSRIATISVELESKLMNISDLVGTINVELTNLKRKFVTIPGFSFSTVGELVGRIVAIIKILGLTMMGIVLLILVRNFFRISYSSKVIAEVSSYMIVLMVGFLAALFVRLWLHTK